MKQLILLLSALVVGCSGGSGQSAFIQPAGTLMTPFPVQSPTNAPSVAPSPVSSPTAVPLSQRVIAGAPLSATASQLSRIRTQAKTQAQGVQNGVPLLVESSGQVAAWAGDMTSWVSNAQTSADIPETAMTVTASGNLPITNPAPALSCLGSLAAACIAHPTAFTWGTSSANGKPVGKQTLTVAYNDGTTGTTFDYVYDGFSLRCDAGWAYVGSVPVAQSTRATSDVYADCVTGNIVFTQGAVIMANPSQDQYDRYETVLPTLTAAFLGASFFTNAPMPSITQGQVFGINTRDGGSAKIYFSSGVSIGGPIIASGMSLHAKVDGSYAY